MLDIDPLTDLTIKLSRHSMSNESKYREICVCVGRAISSANRVSLWRFENNRTTIRCLTLMHNQQFVDDIDIQLHQSDYQEYFEAILREEVVVASNARVNTQTNCFNETYFEPFEIYSLLDFIFHHDFKPIGIICCEATGSPVTWSDRDVSMLRRLANITSMFY